jgi:hypothetical protein
VLFVLLTRDNPIRSAVGFLDYQSSSDAVSTNRLAAVLQRFIIGTLTSGEANLGSRLAVGRHIGDSDGISHKARTALCSLSGHAISDGLRSATRRFLRFAKPQRLLPLEPDPLLVPQVGDERFGLVAFC